MRMRSASNLVRTRSTRTRTCTCTRTCSTFTFTWTRWQPQCFKIDTLIQGLLVAGRAQPPKLVHSTTTRIARRDYRSTLEHGGQAGSHDADTDNEKEKDKDKDKDKDKEAIANSVWVQLYIGGKESGEVFPVDLNVDASKCVHALKEAVYQANNNVLGHCNAPQLVVYNNEKVKLNPWDGVPKDTNGPNPLVVEAPAQLNQQVTPIQSPVREYPPQQSQGGWKTYHF
jgi:hypothetical protein